MGFAMGALNVLMALFVLVIGAVTLAVLVLFVVPALLGMLEDISAFRTRIVRGWRTLGDDRDLYGDRAD